METSSLVTEIFDEAGNAVTGFSGVLTKGINGVTSLFWDGTSLTMLGTLMVIGIGVSVVYFGFRLIKSLIHK